MGSATYNFTGAWQDFKVPSNVKTVKIICEAAGSGSIAGGSIQGTLAVTPGRRILILVPAAAKVRAANHGAEGGIGAAGDGGDAGGPGQLGGNAGGGYAALRFDSTSGRIICVAGGAGGNSGDGGRGGLGGGLTGGKPTAGNAGTGIISLATPGTRDQGGFGGVSTEGRGWSGTNAGSTPLTPAGDGGDNNGQRGPGGGGGGGGFHSGGGGNGGHDGFYPASAGAGGSSYNGLLTAPVNNQGGGGTGAGRIQILWDDPSPGHRRPNTPSLVSPDRDKRLGTNRVTIKATISDPDHSDLLRMRVGLYTSADPDPVNTYSPYVKSGADASVTLHLSPNLHYYARVYAVDRAGHFSLNYTVANFYSNYSPTEPTLNTPGNGAQYTGVENIPFTWTPHDPDGQTQSAAQLAYRVDAQGSKFKYVDIKSSGHIWVAPAGTFRSNTFYVWQVRTRDPGGLWGPWAAQYRFFVSGTSTPPLPLHPIKNEAVDVGAPVLLSYRFRSPSTNGHQTKADLRYKVTSADDDAWTVVLGTVDKPGAATFFRLTGQSFRPGLQYEWQIRTYNSATGGILPSDWSDSATFRTVFTPGALSGSKVVVSDNYQGTLGCGHNEAYLVTKGGRHLLGKLTPYSSIKWERKRDDISTASLTIPLDGQESTVQLCRIMRTWQHELKIYRDGEGVWEGPITRIGLFADRVEIEAHDLMVWPYRRILRQGYNDTYPNIRSVVDRAGSIIINALAIDDPEILPYLTLVKYDDDARQSRVKPDWSSLAWEEVDDMAAKAGLDYTTVGRRIILWDTHRSIGRLPQMSSSDFSDPPVITEYGMSYANVYGVTDNAGNYGFSRRTDKYTGPVEMLDSSYGDTATASDGTLTPAARQALKETFTAQADRNIADRSPVPILVRVPDNSTLSPDTTLGVNQLVPGVWIPLLAEHPCRTLRQWQKLDSVTVLESADSPEQVQVTMSPAPNSGEDPDSTGNVTDTGDDSGA